MTFEQLYTPGVRRVLELDTNGLPMIVWLADEKPTNVRDRVVAAHLAHLLNGTLIVDNDVL